MNRVEGKPDWRKDVGQGGIEFVAIIVAAVIIVSGIILAATPLGATLSYKLCEAINSVTGGLQCMPPDRAETLDIPCVTAQTDREDSAHVTVYGIRAGGDASDQLKVNADGTATVTLSQGREVGVEVGKDTGGAGLKGDAYAVVGGDLKYNYTFPSEAEARKFLEDRRGAGDRVVDMLVPFSQTVANWFDSDHKPDSFTVALSGKVAGWASIGKWDKSSSAVGGVGGGGKVNASISVSGEATVGLKDGTSSFSGTAELSGDIAGGFTAGAGEDALKLGIDIKAGVGGGGKWQYKVEFDANGQPSKLIMTSESSWKITAEEVLKAGKVKVGPNQSFGAVEVNTSTLDLKVPANRAAFDGIFAYSTVKVGDSYVPFVAINPVAEFGPPMQALAQRCAADCYLATYKYFQQGGDAKLDVDVQLGLHGGGLNVGDTKWRNLLSATGRDMRTGGAETPLVTCG